MEQWNRNSWLTNTQCLIHALMYHVALTAQWRKDVHHVRLGRWREPAAFPAYLYSIKVGANTYHLHETSKLNPYRVNFGGYSVCLEGQLSWGWARNFVWILFRSVTEITDFHPKCGAIIDKGERLSPDSPTPSLRLIQSFIFHSSFRVYFNTNITHCR